MPGYCSIDIFSRVCLGLITVVVVISGIYSIAVLVKINRLIDEAAKIIRQTKEFIKPFQTVAGIILGLTKFSQFFRGKKKRGRDKNV
jgi:CHASE3 domain sensor protein